MPSSSENAGNRQARIQRAREWVAQLLATEEGKLAIAEATNWTEPLLKATRTIGVSPNSLVKAVANGMVKARVVGLFTFVDMVSALHWQASRQRNRTGSAPLPTLDGLWRRWKCSQCLDHPESYSDQAAPVCPHCGTALSALAFRRRPGTRPRVALKARELAAVLE